MLPWIFQRNLKYGNNRKKDPEYKFSIKKEKRFTFQVFTAIIQHFTVVVECLVFRWISAFRWSSADWAHFSGAWRWAWSCW